MTNKIEDISQKLSTSMDGDTGGGKSPIAIDNVIKVHVYHQVTLLRRHRGSEKLHHQWKHLEMGKE